MVNGTKRLLAIMVWLAAVTTGGCRSSTEESAISAARQDLTGACVGSLCTVTIQLPADLLLRDVALLANGRLVLADRADVVGQQGSSPSLVNIGPNVTELGTDTVAPRIDSVGAVLLRDRARVLGTVRTASTATLGNGAVVQGGISQGVSLNTADRATWTATFPSGSAPVTLYPDQTLSLAPGHYGSVQVFSRARLVLAGEYTFESLMVEPQAKLDTTGGATRLAIRSSFTFRGDILGGADFVLTYFGSGTASVESSFRGAIIAPNAKLTLGTGGRTHTGTFFARDIELSPDVLVVHQPLIGSQCDPATVDDGNPCTADQCAADGTEVFTPLPAGSSCADADACNGTETCDGAGACQPGLPVALDDGNPCTVDGCDPSNGVVHLAGPSGTSCSDGNQCNGTETCDGAGECMPGVPPVLDDGNPCTEDTCEAAAGVLHSPREVGTLCLDADICNGEETCDAAGTCTPGTPLQVDDGDPCTSDTCDPFTGVAHPPAPEGTSCSDGNQCNGTETCDGDGGCQTAALPVVDDGNPCTSDACNPEVGVIHASVPAGTPCADADLCNGTEICDGSGACIAAVPSQIDDGNPCTSDACTPAAGVTHTLVAAGTPCSDGDVCNGSEVCSASGACEVGVAIDVDDGNPCTTDTCDPVTGAVHQVAVAGTPCADGDVCNGAEVCSAGGVCTPGALPVVDDGNPCTIDSCDALAGVLHVPGPEGVACGDDDVCNGDETCDAGGRCVAGASVLVDDGNPCTVDSCDPNTGVTHVPALPGQSCWDADRCNGDEECDGNGTCLPGQPVVIDDGNPCTLDACDSAVGVVHVNRPLGEVCGDLNACNGSESCDGEGRCIAGQPPALDDANPCTVDVCDSVTGVAHVPLPAGTSCSDGDACTGAEVCSDTGECLPGTPPQVNDGNPCTLDLCDPLSGVQHTSAPAGVSCGDGNPCNGAEVCDAASTCLPGVPPVVDDGNACTLDTCTPDEGIVHAPVPAGTSCADADLCNGDEQCDGAGTCTGGGPSGIDDGNPCTLDSCTPETGVRHELAPSGHPCSDGDACNGPETCDAQGTCQAGTPLVSDDGNPCTSDSCDRSLGVQHEVLPSGSDCGDGDRCNGSEACDGFARCVAGPPPAVDDGNPCTTDACDAVQGVTHTPNVGTPCGDEDLCNGAELCDASGACAPGIPPEVDDGNPCTTDSCDPLSGVRHVALAMGSACSDGSVCNGQETCDASGICLAGVPLETDDGDPCTVDACDPVTGVTHTLAAPGTACPYACGGAGTCDDRGICLPTSSTPPLDDGNPCTLDECDPESGARFTPLPGGASCSDGNPCNGEEICDASANCLPGMQVETDDGNPCTVDRCDSTGTVTHEPAPGGTGCDDGDLCNGSEICDGQGLCSAGLAAPLDDGDECTADSCDPLLGVVHQWLETAECTGNRSSWAPMTEGRPSPRDSVAAAFDTAGGLVAFGGENAGGTLRDTWLWDAETNHWRVRYFANGPSARAAAAMTYDAQRARYVLFGGVSGTGPNADYLSDTWEFDPSSETWVLRSASQGPSPRAYAAITYDAATHRVLLFGGVAGGTFADTWEWNGASGAWLEQPVSGPSPRAGAALAYDASRGRAVLFGGSDEAGSTYGDTWEWSSASRSWAERATPVAPAARTGHAMAFQPQAGRVVLLGGTSADQVNFGDLWALDGAGWTLVDGAVASGPRAGHSLGVVAGSDSLVLHGGLQYSSTGRVTPQSDEVWAYEAPYGWRERTSATAPAGSIVGLAFDAGRGVFVGLGNAPSVTTWELNAGAARWEAKDAFLGQDIGSGVGAPIGATAIVYDAERASSVLFARSDEQTDAQWRIGVWEWNGSLWSDRQCPGAPLRREYSVVAHDPAQRTSYIVGGQECVVYGLAVQCSDALDMVTLNHSTCEWERRESPYAPNDAAAAFDSDRRVLTVFGGGWGGSWQNLLGQTWEYDVDARSWAQVGAAGPSPRRSAAMVYDRARQKAVLFGGYTDRWMADTWEYTPESGWVEVTPDSSPAVEDAKLAWDPVRSRVVLAGGTDPSVWEWTGTEWVRRGVASAPVARSGASGGWYRPGGLAVMFGGVSGDGQRDYLDELWVWQGTWREPDVAVVDNTAVYKRVLASRWPSPRAGHVLAVGVNRSGLLFGGEGDSGLLGDTWTLDLETLNWTERKAAASDPSPRAGHAMALLPDQSPLLFGGRAASGPTNDTFRHNGTVWSQVSITNPPVARWGHAMATDTARGRVVMFGGRSASGVLNDTWEYVPTAPTGTQWQRIVPPVSPLPRFGHQLVYDRIRQRIVLTGGSGTLSDQSFEDTWEWDGLEWVERGPRLPLRAGAGHFAFFDEQRGEVLVFGGLSHREAGHAAVSLGDMWAFEGADRGDERLAHADGTQCTGVEDCASGFCVDGVCCNTACDLLCGACNVAGREGSCIAASGPPRGDRGSCPAGPGGDCGLRCDGVDMGECHMAPSGLVCGQPDCSNGVIHTSSGVCDGNGTCARAATSCSPYACGTTTAGVAFCYRDCGSDEYCLPGYHCNIIPGWGGICVP